MTDPTMPATPTPLVVCDRCGKSEHVTWREIAAWTRAHPSKCSAKKATP